MNRIRPKGSGFIELVMFGCPAEGSGRFHRASETQFMDMGQ